MDFLSIILGVLDSRSRGLHPARTVSQAKEGEMLSTEELPRNQQRLPKMYSLSSHLFFVLRHFMVAEDHAAPEAACARYVPFYSDKIGRCILSEEH